MCKALEALERRGFESGKRELLKQMIEKKLAKGKSIVIIANELEENPEVIQKIIDEIRNGGRSYGPRITKLHTEPRTFLAEI